MTRLSLLFLPAAVLMGQVVPPSTAIFDRETVHEIRLTFKQADWYQQLTTDYAEARDNTPYREASLTWGQYTFETVGVRFKGNSSYNGATTRKKPFRIKLNEFVKGQKIDGMASFGLSNGWNDPSFVREKPYYELAAAAGLAAPRSNFSALYINDEYWGLYILGEIVNGDFLEGHFGKSDDDGNLYKASDPGANLAYLGADPAAYQRFFSKESNEEADDWTDLIELARIFDQTPVAELPSKLGTLVDVDSFLTALALDNLTVNLDSYVGMAQNYYLYRRSSDQKWVWIPWDPSLAFGALGQGLTVQQMKDLALEYVQTGGIGGGFPGGGGAGGGGLGGGTRPIATKLWQVPEYKQRYRQIYQRLVDNVLNPSQLIGRMNTLRDMIRPWVEKDTQKLVTMAQFDAAMTSEPATNPGTGTPGGPGGGGGFNMGGAPGLQPFIEGRVTSVKAQLAGQAPLVISATPSSLVFAQVTGSSATTGQQLALSLPEGAPAGNYTATASASWITLGSTSGSFPASIRVSTNAGGMNAGTYTGSVTITTAGATNSPLAIPVSLTVVASPALVTNPSSLTFIGGFGGPQGPGGPNIPNAGVTQTINVISTAGVSPYSVAISDATCSNVFTVSPVNGVTPAAVTVSANGANATSACTARIVVSSPNLAVASVPVALNIGTLPGGNQAPIITAIANSASYATGPFAPGTLVAIFGMNFGPRNLVRGTFTDGQLTTNLNGLQVTFDGTPAPILYARFDQIAVAVPFEVSGKTQVAVQVSAFGGQAGAPFPQAVSVASPAIYTASATGSGQASITNQNGSANAAIAAATKGSTISLYITGAGQMMPAGRTGALGGADQAIVAPVTVTIGGQSARVVYAGATQASVQGLYQIKAVVPDNALSGSVPVQVTVGQVSAQNGVTMYVQ